ncbi:CDK-activating kinase assembly factor MAT1 [Cyclospora cayetanensis]|uniref:CDK-activating kinase assembly factor MAT1 n=1 Tax=Cyclospora cayetanensis TaxID=88456 RepID=A0A6P6RSZ3_9EIME|nr:CDK-activating kinase assembly factor MAT1 [Cyclospora cayetanensis]
MDQYQCPVCYENCCYNPEKKLYYSDVCSHRLCDSCIQLQFADAPVGVAASAKGSCPVCRRALTRGNYVLTEPEVDLFSVEKEVRKRVNNALNALRDNFDSTPAYNDYLEDKEETIYELVYGTDDQLKRRLENRLRDIEGHGRTQSQHHQQKQQQQQQQNSDARAALRVRKIKEIVKKEGNFYEIVKYKPLGKNLKFNDEPYLHVLERQYSSLFHGDSAGVSHLTAAAGTADCARPIDASIREDQHIPRRRYTSVADFDAAGVAAGYVPELVRGRGRQELCGMLLLSSPINCSARAALGVLCSSFGIFVPLRKHELEREADGDSPKVGAATLAYGCLPPAGP